VRAPGSFVLVALMLGACGQAPTPADSGVPDAGGPDSGAPDAGPPPLEVHFLAAADGGAIDVSSRVYSLPFWVRVTGAPPGESITLTSRLQSYSAQATFTALADGTVDTARDAPTAGSYDGADPDGLVWSSTPGTSSIGSSYDLRVDADGDAGHATATLHRPGMGTGTTYGSVTVDTAPGYYFQWPSDAGLRPAVLVLGGSECDLSTTEFLAAYVSTLGVNALALDYCTPQHFIYDIPLERVRGAVDWLAARPEVDPSKLGLMGASRGGELALQMAALEPRLSAVAAFVPSPYRWGDTAAGTHSAWTLDGGELPYVPDCQACQPTVEMLGDGGVGYRSASAALQALAAAPVMAVQDATIAFTSSTATFLLVGGSDDGVWPSCTFIADGWNMLADAGHTAAHAGDTTLCAMGAGHIFGPPGWSTVEGYSLYDPVAGYTLIVGGTAQGRGRGQRQADTLWRALFSSTFGLAGP
jgi:acetyl esterase/lipase